MQAQTLQARAVNQREKLSELAQKVYGQKQECGRDSDVYESHPVDVVNWNKGWGKYGKT